MRKKEHEADPVTMLYGAVNRVTQWGYCAEGSGFRTRWTSICGRCAVLIDDVQSSSSRVQVPAYSRN